MKYLLYVLSLLFTVGAAAALDAVTSPVKPASLGVLPDFRLLDQAGCAHTMRRYPDAPAIALMAVPADDDALDSHLAKFADLARKYASDQIQFFLLTPSAQVGTLAARAGGVPVLLDDAQIVLPAIGLGNAYECLLAETAHWTIQFRGDLDAIGEASRGLGDALDAFKSHTLEPFLTPARGPELALDPAPQGITYAADVAPILISKCVGCHSDGNIGPFAMSSHKKVAGWGDMMAETVRNGRMPPWSANPEYGKFSNSLALTNTEKRVLLAWLDAGAPAEGDADPLAQVKHASPKEWRIGTPDKIISLPEPQEIPAEGVVDYKYYEVPLDLPEGTWLRGTEVRVTQPQVMHHVLVYLHLPGQDIDFTEEYIASYVPGHDPGLYPEGTGKPVPKGAKLLFQLHYTPSGKAVTDNPQLGLYFCDKPPAHEIFLGSAVNHHIAVPAFAPNYEASASFTAPSDILIYSLSPHMHYRGKSMNFEAHYPSGKQEMLLAVPDYDFYWQHSYHLAEPKRVPKGTVIQVAGAFDNSIRNPINPDPSQSLSWGEQSTDEMFIGSILYREAD